MKATVQDSDGFTTVKYKRKRKPQYRFHPVELTHTFEATSDLNGSKVEKIMSDLNCSEFFQTFKESLHSILRIQTGKSLKEDASINSLTQNMNEICIKDSNINIVCYGLGHFMLCPIARYQLAFLLLLRDLLQPTTIHIFDPVFSLSEKQLLTELGLDVLNVNEEGKRNVTHNTIFYMPHCDLPLYNNLLWANFKKDNLSKMIIIGNSFKNYYDKTPSTKLKEKAMYIYLVNDFVSEVKLSNSFQFSDVFNDLSVHYFLCSNLDTASCEIWNCIREPVYENDEIIKASKC